MNISTRFLWVVFAVILIVCPVSLNAQKYNKYSDSYNFRKGMEALDERDSKKAEESFAKEIEEHPENGYAYLYLSHLQFRNEEFGRALSSIDNALKYIPKKDKEYKGACHYKRAGIYEALEKYEEAITDFTMAISYNPEDDDSYWERAQIYYEQEKYDLADADYRAMQKLDANSPLPYMGLGQRYK